jgi:membrane protein insertase Oxa1/YidC/SpoIIIJ
MTGVFPNKLPLNPETTISFASEGALWFQNLTLPDPYYVLPVILVCTNLLNIEVCLQYFYAIVFTIIVFVLQLHAIRRQAPSRGQRIMTYLFRFLTIGMGYVASQLPAVSLSHVITMA